MSRRGPITVQSLRDTLSKFEATDPLEAVWASEAGKAVLKDVSRLVRRKESKNGQAGRSPRERVLKAMTSSATLDFPLQNDMERWLQDYVSFWTIRVDFNGKSELNVMYENLSSRFQLLPYLDNMSHSLHIRRRFLCLFFHDFTQAIHPNAERVGSAMIQTLSHQLGLCGFREMNVEFLRKALTTGKRLNDLSLIAGNSALFCLPPAADDYDRLEQLGELVPQLAYWMQENGLKTWGMQPAADALGAGVRKCMVDSLYPGSGRPALGFDTATNFGFMNSG